jgi:hypothetical protein
MRFRKLRIAFSATCLIACVLLIALWVRSYWGRTSKQIFANPTDGYYIHSLDGSVAFEKEDRLYLSYALYPLYIGWDNLHIATHTGIKIWRESNGKIHAVSISYWLINSAVIVLAAAPWIRWSKRFSLRTLLIATTLVAVVLGLIVWLGR